MPIYQLDHPIQLIWIKSAINPTVAPGDQCRNPHHPAAGNWLGGVGTHDEKAPDRVRGKGLGFRGGVGRRDGHAL